MKTKIVAVMPIGKLETDSVLEHLTSPKSGIEPDLSQPEFYQPIRRLKLHDQIVDDIGRKIVSGHFGETGILPTENELSTELGVSRNALREAIKVLISKGMIEVRPKTGTKIRPLGDWNLLDRDVLNWHAQSELQLKRAFELVEFRLIIEPKTAFLAAKRGKDDDIDLIEKAYVALERCVETPDLIPHCDIAFHRSIHHASHNAILHHLGSLTSSLMQIQILMTTQEPGSFERGLPLHQSLTRAIKERDAEAAEKISRRLVQMPYDDLAQRLSFSKFYNKTPVILE